MRFVHSVFHKILLPCVQVPIKNFEFTYSIMSQKGTPKDWSKLTVAELKEALSERGMIVSGRKSELVERLSLYEKEIKEEEEEKEEEQEEEKNAIEIKEECDAEMVEASEKEICDIECQNEKVTEEDAILKEDIAEETGVQQEESEVSPEETGVQQKESEVSHDVNEEEMEHEEQNDKDEDMTEMLKEESEKPKEKEEIETQSRADSLSVNLDQDIGNLRDLDESNVEQEESSKGPDGFIIDRKGEDTDGITIETVGEVDDDEFGAAVANIDDATMKEEVKEENRKETTTEPMEEEKDPLKGLPPIPISVLPNWMIKKYNVSKRFSSLYIKPLSSKDILCAAMVEWASRAVYFCINYQRDGKGLAVLNFMTEKECVEAKDVLSKTLTEDIKVIHPSRQIEKEFQEELKYKLEIPNLAQRTLIVEGAPEGTTEDQVCLLFPGAISVSKPDVTSMIYKWQGQDYALPESVTNIFIVEFGYYKAAERAVASDKEYEIKEQTLKVRTMTNFQKEYKEMVTKLEEEARKKKQIENERKRKEREKKSLEEVYSDKERIEMCRALKNTIKKRAAYLKRMDVPWNERLMVKEKLSTQVIDIVRALDVDTDKRVKAGLKFPENEQMMTKHTRQLYFRNLREQKVKQNREKKLDSAKDVSKGKLKSNSEKIQDQKKPGTDDTTIDQKETQVKEKPSVKSESGLDNKKQKKKEESASKDEQNKKSQTNQKASEIAKSPNKATSAKQDRPLTEKDKQEINRVLRGLEADKRGWWTVKITKPSKDFRQNEFENKMRKYGRVEEIHHINKNVYVRYSSREAVVTAMRKLWTTAYKPEVPPVQQKWKVTKSDSNRSDNRRGSERQRSLDRDHQGKGNVPSLLTANTTPIANQLQRQAQQQMLLQQQLQQQQLKQQQEQLAMMQAMQQQQQMQALGGQAGILGPVPQKSPLPMQSGMTNQMGKGQMSGTQRNNIPSLFGASGVPPLSDERHHDRERTQRGRSPERRSRFDRKSPVQTMPVHTRDSSPPYHQDVKRSRREDEYNYGFKPTNQHQRQSSAASDRPAVASGDSSAVANVLKGITQVLSSKMEELSRLGGASGQKAMKEVIDSIGNIQGVASGGLGGNIQGVVSGGMGGSGSASSNTGNFGNQQSSSTTGSQGFSAYNASTANTSVYGGSNTSTYGSSSANVTYGGPSGEPNYGRSSVPSAPGYSNLSSYSSSGPAHPTSNVYSASSAGLNSQPYGNYSQQLQKSQPPIQSSNVGNYGSSDTTQYASPYQQTGQRSYGSRY